MASMGSSWGEIEEALGSRGRIRILRCLYTHRSAGLTRYRIARETGLSQREVRRLLGLLVELGWVSQTDTSPRTYRLNLGKRAVEALVEFFEALDEVER